MNQLIFFANSQPHIAIAPETIFSIGPLGITNSMILGVFGYALLLWAFIYTAKVVRTGKKRNRLVQFIVWIYEELLSIIEGVIPDKNMARSVAPLPITLFFFIILQYWLGILPIAGPITWDGQPIFRGFDADLNTTFGLAIIVIVATQIYAVKVHGFFGNIGRYIRNPIKDPAGAFEGLLELVAEFSRMVGLSFRLFGNVFAGEVLLVIIAYLTKTVAVAALPPFYIFELFIGTIQAYIFFMLATVFISLAVAHHGDAPHSDHSPAAHKHATASGNS
ncbi:MAG: F0F1 ATP synthase subunit A [Candidatus Saccharimonas sp.]